MSLLVELRDEEVETLKIMLQRALSDPPGASYWIYRDAGFRLIRDLIKKLDPEAYNE